MTLRFFQPFILVLVVTLSAKSQTQNIKYTAKTIIEPRNIYLNGGARASMGGKSRTVIPIQLPPNTYAWYYSFSTTPGASGIQNLNLLAQLSTIALNPIGLTSAITSNIKVPQGSYSIDAYLLDQSNSDLFAQKVDNNGGRFSCYRDGVVTNTRQAVVAINNEKQGVYYLGLKNPSAFDGVNITVEVVAIVAEKESSTEEQSEAITFGNLGWKAFQRGDYDKCLELSKQALSLDNTLGYVYFNIGLSQLMKGQNSEAIATYTKAIAVAKKTIIPKQTLIGGYNDLKTYFNNIPSKNDAQDIMEILVAEIKHYN